MNSLKSFLNSPFGSRKKREIESYVEKGHNLTNGKLDTKVIVYTFQELPNDLIPYRSVQEITLLGQIKFDTEHDKAIKNSLINDTFQGNLDKGNFDTNQDYIDYLQIECSTGKFLAVASASSTLDSPNPMGFMWLVEIPKKLEPKTTPGIHPMWKAQDS